MALGSRLTSLARSVLRSPQAQRVVRDLVRSAGDAIEDRGTAGPGGDRRSSTRQRSGTRSAAGTDRRDGGAAHGALADRAARPPIPLTYAPVDDDRPDPGEIVWAWVPFEEDLGRGKDRPVLVLAREDARTGGSDGTGQVLVCLMLTSHDRGRGEHVDEHGHTWVDIGTGTWDRQGRASEVRADRLLRIGADAVRREGAKLDAVRFDAVARATRRVQGWDR